MNDRLTTYTDAELSRFLKGVRYEAELAFGEIYRRHNQRIYAYCLKVTGSADEARDIFQETFVRFFKGAVGEECILNIGGYLMRIARNLCLNYHRDKKETVSFEEFHGIVEVHNYEQEELLRLIRTALEYLDVDDREVFILRMYHDMSYDEISELTGDTISALKNRVWRAKEKVKKILAPHIHELANI